MRNAAGGAIAVPPACTNGQAATPNMLIDRRSEKVRRANAQGSGRARGHVSRFQEILVAACSAAWMGPNPRVGWPIGAHFGFSETARFQHGRDGIAKNARDLHIPRIFQSGT